MRMHNPPHPGLVLREYLGNLSVSTAAAHLRATDAGAVRRKGSPLVDVTFSYSDGRLQRHSPAAGE